MTVQEILRFLEGFAPVELADIPQQGEDLGALVDGVVLHELELGGIAQVEGAAQLAAQIAGGGLEALDHFFHVALVQHADVDLAKAQVRGGLHRRDGHQTMDPGVLDGANEGGQLPLDLLVDTSDAITCHVVLLFMQT